jgi:3-isopropylmalate/(R)-2-methylmalate dehydratase small subunit
MRGKAHIFGDDINTDYIISGKYKFKTLDMGELATHLFEDLVPDFSKKVDEDDMIVAGENFGCGSSREQAPLVIRGAGISCVVARSFARIFYRNSINVGLPLVECDTRRIEEGDVLIVELEKGILTNESKGEVQKFKPLPPVMESILGEGGLARYIKLHGGFPSEK